MKVGVSGCIIFATLGVWAVAACRTPAADSSTLTILYPGGDMVLGLPEDDSPKQLVFLPMVRMGANNELEGRLLRGAERLPGTTTWIYHLRSDVRWHDGVPFTAHDVVFTIDLMRDTLINWLAPGASTLEATDDTTLRVSYSMANAGSALLHLDTWQVYFPKHLLKDLDRRQFGAWEFWKRPIGNGPYRFVRSQPKELIVLEANPDFYAGRPAIDRVVLRLGEPQLAPLLSGEVDLMDIEPENALALADDPRFTVRFEVGDMRIGALWNHRDSLFREAAVRRALTLAVDRPTLQRALNLSGEVLVTDGVYTRRQYRTHDLAPALPYDPDHARSLLDSLGWRDHDGDGVRDRAGRPFRFTAITTPESARAAVLLQEALRRIGVAMEVQPLDAGLVTPRLRSGDFSAVVARIRNTYDGRYGVVRAFGPRSFLGYRNARVDGVLERLRMAFEPTEIEAGYRELGDLIAADVPVTYLAVLATGTVSTLRVRGGEAFDSPSPFEIIDRLSLKAPRPAPRR